MRIKKSAIITGKQTDNRALQRAINNPDTKDRSVLQRADVLKEIRTLLDQEGLSVKDIISKYKEIYSVPYEKPKASDIIKLLESLQKLHGLSDNSTSDDTITLTLQSKSTQEITEYLQGVLKRTQEITARLQERRINKK